MEEDVKPEAGGGSAEAEPEAVSEDSSVIILDSDDEPDAAAAVPAVHWYPREDPNAMHMGMTDMALRRIAADVGRLRNALAPTTEDQDVACMVRALGPMNMSLAYAAAALLRASELLVEMHDDAAYHAYVNSFVCYACGEEFEDFPQDLGVTCTRCDRSFHRSLTMHKACTVAGGVSGGARVDEATFVCALCVAAAAGDGTSPPPPPPAAAAASAAAAEAAVAAVDARFETVHHVYALAEQFNPDAPMMKVDAEGVLAVLCAAMPELRASLRATRFALVGDDDDADAYAQCFDSSCDDDEDLHGDDLGTDDTSEGRGVVQTDGNISDLIDNDGVRHPAEPQEMACLVDDLIRWLNFFPGDADAAACKMQVEANNVVVGLSDLKGVNRALWDRLRASFVAHGMPADRIGFLFI